MATNRSGRCGLIAAAAVGLLLVASATSLAGSPPAAERRGAWTDRAWSGFRIDVDDRASGSWFGARKIGSSPGRVVYRIDPSASPRPDGFGRLRLVTRVPGPGPKLAASARQTARAAWILSKYGTYDYEIQSAAVDAAVLHLLAGRDYALDGSVGRARLRETGAAEAIKRFAKVMLRDSIRKSGPYRLTIRQEGESAIGDPVRMSVQVVVARSGVPLTSVPISVRLGRGPWRLAGETDDAGRLAFTYVGTAAGPQQVTARVARVPEHHLLLMEPRRAAASRVAVAGRKHVLATPTTASVKARPGATVTAASILSGNKTFGSLRISGAYGSSAKSAVVTLRGPFGSLEQTTCERKALRLRHVPVAGNGRYQLPRLEVRQAGFYVWQVMAPGDLYNLDATACDGGFRVRPRE